MYERQQQYWLHIYRKLISNPCHYMQSSWQTHDATHQPTESIHCSQQSFQSQLYHHPTIRLGLLFVAHFNTLVVSLVLAFSLSHSLSHSLTPSLLSRFVWKQFSVTTLSSASRWPHRLLPTAPSLNHKYPVLICFVCRIRLLHVASNQCLREDKGVQIAKAKTQVLRCRYCKLAWCLFGIIVMSKNFVLFSWSLVFGF